MISAVVEDEKQKYAENKALKKQTQREWIEETLNRTREEKNRRMQQLEEQAKLYFSKLKPDSEEEKNYMQELTKLRQKLHMQTDKEYKSLRKILERNPGAVSRIQTDALREIREMFQMKK